MFTGISERSGQVTPRHATKSGVANGSKIRFISGTEARPSSPAERRRVVIIDRRALYRECLARSLISRRVNWVVVTASSVTEWRKKVSTHDPDPAFILLSTGKYGAVDIEEQLALLCDVERLPPVALLHEPEDLEKVVAAFGQGVRGYIPSDAPVDLVIHALDLIELGGAFVPASSLLSYREMLPEHSISNASGYKLTSREHAVLASLRQGRSNKCIAYDLDMSESTVKVHVRNLMKKLKARNRTEVAFLTRSMFNEDQDEWSHGSSERDRKVKIGGRHDWKDQDRED
jgi:DNA-binding NarL/FixJ family response regulator